MKDTHKPLRKAYYQLLKDVLVYDNTTIPVCDEKQKQGQDNSTCVILSTVSSNPTNTFNGFSREATIVLDIVCKTPSAVSKDIVDSIAEQILELVIPTPATNGLPAQNGFQILNVVLDNDRYLNFSVSDTQSVMRRLLTFRQSINQI